MTPAETQTGRLGKGVQQHNRRSVVWVAWELATRVRSFCQWLFFWLLRGSFFKSIGFGTRFFGRVRFGSVNGNISVGRYCWIGHDVFLSAGRKCEITIGDRVSVNTGCHLVALEGITIGANSSIGEYVSIRDQNHVFDDAGRPVKDQGFACKAIQIGEDVWIGRGVMVCPGVTIGTGAVVGANSVVTKDVEPFMVVVGCPAKPVRRRGEAAGTLAR